MFFRVGSLDLFWRFCWRKCQRKMHILLATCLSLSLSLSLSLLFSLPMYLQPDCLRPVFKKLSATLKDAQASCHQFVFVFVFVFATSLSLPSVRKTVSHFERCNASCHQPIFVRNKSLFLIQTVAIFLNSCNIFPYPRIGS